MVFPKVVYCGGASSRLIFSSPSLFKRQPFSFDIMLMVGSPNAIPLFPGCKLYKHKKSAKSFIKRFPIH